MATSQTHSPVLEPAIQDEVLQQYPNTRRANSDARKAEKVPRNSSKASSIYSPLALGCIRVLQLQPAPRLEDPLSGTLEIVHLNDGTQYEALSYTWGNTFVNDEKSTAWIKTDDDRLRFDRAFLTQPSKLGVIRLCNSTITTAANLDAALKRLRSSGNVRSLWIDALCIDQANPVERSSQVAQIAQVFAHARQTIVWLGEDSIHCDGQFVFACCRRYEQDNNSRWRTIWRRAVKQAPFKMWFALLYCQPKSRLFWDIWDEQPFFWWTADRQVRQFRLFAARRYFSRLWCVQEVASADHVIVKCGGSELPWSTFRAYINHDRTLSRRRVGKLPAITKDSEHAFERLMECSDLQCSDERDYIYAISSLLKLCGDCPRIQIDYMLECRTVFTNFARDYVILNGYTAAWNVLTIAAGRRDTELTPSMPSWVPDWRPRSPEIEGKQVVETSFAQRTRKNAAALERSCRAAGRDITVAFDDCTMKIDLWYCGQLGERAKSKLYSGLESSDCLYSLPPEYGSYGNVYLALRSCVQEKSVFQAIALVTCYGPGWDKAGRSFEEAIHRVSIV